jgi:hypothetical protein
MRIRNFITFHADFPDDSKWDEHDNCVIPGGRTLAQALLESLKNRGCNCSTVSQHSFYGWTFEAWYNNVKIWCLLQGGDDWFLLLEPRPSLAGRLAAASTAAAVHEFQNRLHACLTGDDRFSKILWYRKQDYESRNWKSASPVP